MLNFISEQNNDAMMLSLKKQNMNFIIFSVSANLNSISELKRLIKVMDVLGREVKEIKNIPLFLFMMMVV